MAGRSDRRRPRTRLAVALLTSLVLAAVACTPSHSFTAGPVVIATGGTQGVYYSYGVGLAQQLEAEHQNGLTAKAISTEGSLANIAMVVSGAANFGFSAADAAADAATGRSAFAGHPQPIRAVARLYDDYVHLLVPASSAITQVGDLRGHRVAIGSNGSGTALIGMRVLHAAGMVPGVDVETLPLGLNDAIAALRQGSVDAFFWSGGLPTAGVTDLARIMPVRLLSLLSVVDALRMVYGSTYRLARVPASTYPGIEPVTALAVANYLITSVDTADDLVAAVTRLLHDNRLKIAKSAPIAANFDQRSAIFTAPVDLHPGSLRYYRSVKP
jgi:TRAP transporter TAXI family solute receptor